MATGSLYGNVHAKAFNGEINWASDTIKGLLTTSAYTPNQDSHIYLSSVTNEITGTGYTAGGVTLASKTLTYSSKTTTFSCAALSWASATFTARRLVIYKSTGTGSTSPLIGWVDFGVDMSPSGGTFTWTPDPAGVFTITVA